MLEQRNMTDIFVIQADYLHNHFIPEYLHDANNSTVTRLQHSTLMAKTVDMFNFCRRGMPISACVSQTCEEIHPHKIHCFFSYNKDSVFAKFVKTNVFIMKQDKT